MLDNNICLTCRPVLTCPSFFVRWRAPGAAPVMDACGLAGGSYSRQSGAEAGDYTKTAFAQHGDVGTEVLKPLPGYTPPTYKIGGTAEVTWWVVYTACIASHSNAHLFYTRSPPPHPLLIVFLLHLILTHTLVLNPSFSIFFLAPFICLSIAN